MLQRFDYLAALLCNSLSTAVPWPVCLSLCASIDHNDLFFSVFVFFSVVCLLVCVCVGGAI